MNFFASFRGYVDALVHPMARQDALVAARHRAFIGARILCGLAALGTLPLYLVVLGAPGAVEAVFLAWLLFPLANAYYLSRTGRYETAQILSSFALTMLILLVALGTGGVRSFAAAWLVVVPAEAALATSRRAVAAAAIFAASALGFLCGLEWMDLVPQSAAQNTAEVAALAVLSATLFTTAVALRAQGFVRSTSRQLSIEEARYRLLARHMSDVITRHGPKGAVLFVSPAAQQVFGVAPRELMGHGLFDRVHVGDRPAYLTALSDAATRGGSYSVEFRVKREPDGGEPHGVQYVWIEMRCRALEPGRSDDGSEVVAVMRDVSERKMQQRDVEDARSEAERANAAKSRFLATMSHELRTPLNAIIGFSEMLTKESELNIDGVRRLDYAKLINESGNHLLSVVNGILDMSKIETGNFEIVPEAFAAGPVIANCCDLLALKAHDAGVDLVARVGPLPDIVADKRALKQIVLNLLANAIKFTDRGGRVVVVASADPRGITLTIEDTGVGIGEGDLARIGDPFFQTRDAYTRSHDGSGLGLSIVKGLVELHGGTFDIQSRLGEGTAVTVRLPLNCETGPRDEFSNVMALAPADTATMPLEQQVRKRA